MDKHSDAEVKTCVVISDFNAANLQGFLQGSSERPVVNVMLPDYGQVMQTLLNERHSCWQQTTDMAVIWTQPEAVIASFNSVLRAEEAVLETLLDEVEQFARLVATAAQRVRTVLLPTWAYPPGQRGLGPIDLRPGGMGYALARMNLRLAEILHDHANIFVVDSERWITAQANPAMAAKYWYVSKTPYGPDVFREAAAQIKSLLRAIAGQSRKLLILDLDDTLWGGIVGDIGWENLRLGGHDPVGEAFQDFQRAVKTLQNRGIVLAVVSKNDESTALEAIDKHPEMLLRKNDLAGWRINWNDKVQNIVELVNELNLSMDAAVFIDDNPAERGRVSEALPDLLVPEWPADKLLYRHTLDSLNCFDPASLSAEDAQRSSSYAAERERRQSLAAVSLDEWLDSLELKVRIEALADSNRQRAVQLLNKTNQMNLQTRRLTEDELNSWLNQGDRHFWTVWVTDRFGDSGLTGLISIHNDNGVCRITDFVLSCRVFGRQLENLMAGFAVGEAQRLGATTVEAEFQATAKNKPALEFMAERSGFSTSDNNLFCWDPATEYPLPTFIELTVDNATTKTT